MLYYSNVSSWGLALVVAKNIPTIWATKRFLLLPQKKAGGNARRGPPLAYWHQLTDLADPKSKAADSHFRAKHKSTLLPTYRGLGSRVLKDESLPGVWCQKFNFEIASNKARVGKSFKQNSAFLNNASKRHCHCGLLLGPPRPRPRVLP